MRFGGLVLPASGSPRSGCPVCLAPRLIGGTPRSPADTARRGEVAELCVQPLRCGGNGKGGGAGVSVPVLAVL